MFVLIIRVISFFLSICTNLICCLFFIIVEGWSNVAENGWGFDKFISLSDLEDRTKIFVVND